jgi:hypothetical protein
MRLRGRAVRRARVPMLPVGVVFPFLPEPVVQPGPMPPRAITPVALVRLALTAVLAIQATMLRAQPVEPPAMLLGTFTDDYGYQYRITRETFEMLPRTRYRIVAWDSAGHYLIARADSTAARPGGLWLRIDWMELPAMAPYTWAYCFTAYDAPTADSARATPSADRSAPRTGCGGHPFSRMKRANGS